MKLQENGGVALDGIQIGTESNRKAEEKAKINTWTSAIFMEAQLAV